MLGVFFATEVPIGLRLSAAGPYLSSFLLMLWELNLLVSKPLARRTVLLAISLLLLVVVSDLSWSIYLATSDDWLVPEVTAYIFWIFAFASVAN